MCLTDLNFNRNLAFSFLYHANKEFNERYGQTLDNINPYQYQDFGVYMRDLMVCYVNHFFYVLLFVSRIIILHNLKNLLNVQIVIYKV